MEFQHAEWNFHTQWDVETHKCDYDSYGCHFNTHKSDFYTQSVMLTRMSVIMTLTKGLWHLYVLKPHSACRNHSNVWSSHAYCDEHECNFWMQSVIPTRTSMIYVCRVWFPHAECDFYTQSNVHTQCDVKMHKCDYDTHDCDFNTHNFYTYECDYITHELNFNSIRMTLKRTN
jgi:hypothetical protein